MRTHASLTAGSNSLKGRLYIDVALSKNRVRGKGNALPRKVFNPGVKGIFDCKCEDFKLEGFIAHSHIAASLEV
jgi:hypothetical protein